MPRSARGGSDKQVQAQGNGYGASVKQTDRWVFLINDEVIKGDTLEGENQPTLCKLRHPKMRTGVLYLMSADCTSIYELNSFREKYRSWFVGDSVQRDGQIYITAPVDPLFLVLPYLINSGEQNGRFMTMEQLVCDEDFPESHKLLTCTSEEQLALVTDSRDLDDDLRVYRYSKEKTLSWLKTKMETLADALEDKEVNVSSKGSHSAIFVRSKSSAISRAAYIEYAYGIISDYLPGAVAEELRSYAELPEVNESSSAPDATSENEPPNKKAKLASEVAPVEDYSGCVDLKSDKSKTGKLSAAQKRLSKVDKTGMKSISSFFSPKS